MNFRIPGRGVRLRPRRLLRDRYHSCKNSLSMQEGSLGGLRDIKKENVVVDLHSNCRSWLNRYHKVSGRPSEHHLFVHVSQAASVFGFWETLLHSSVEKRKNISPETE